jgi:hypothetical protein
MILTHKLLMAASTNHGGFNRMQMDLLKVPWPPRHGWLDNLVGTYCPDETWQTVMELRHVKSKLVRREIVQHQGKLL